MLRVLFICHIAMAKIQCYQGLVRYEKEKAHQFYTK